MHRLRKTNHNFSFAHILKIKNKPIYITLSNHINMHLISLTNILL